MDKASHIGVVLDLSPKQWHLAAQPSNPHSITLAAFLSHLLAFVNAHIACNDENSFALFGALPGKRCVLQGLGCSDVRMMIWTAKYDAVLVNDAHERGGD